jgi:proton-dependent oligopeptide transporter, POT family
MAQTKYRTTPENIKGMPPGIPYIIGNEAAERFNFYGLKAILVIYMTQYLMGRDGALAPMNENEASKWFHLFISANYFLPAFGAIIADVFFGKYRTILWLSMLYAVGCVALASDHTRMGLFVGLALIAMGAGGIKPCVSSHVGDQFGPSNQGLLSRAFGWFYLAVNFGSVFSMALTPWLLRDHGPAWAFGVPAALMVLAVVVFWAGRNKFIHVPPAGKSFLKATFTRETARSLGGLAFIFAFMAIFWALFDQCGSTWTLQAAKMDRVVFGFEVMAAQVQVLNALLVILFIPLFQFVLYPLMDRVWKLTPLRKIGLGLFTIGVSFLITAWIDARIVAGETPNVIWQLPAYVILTAGEVMASITALEFAYTQAPRHLKAVVQALYLFSVSAGNLFTAAVQAIIGNPDGTSKLSGPTYFLFYAALAIAAAGAFALVARNYKEKSYLQTEAPAA